jgi:thiol-disulfide isomerase/thioredoxin
MNAQSLGKLQKKNATVTTEIVQKAQTPLTAVQETALQLPGKKTRASLDEYAVDAKRLTNNDLSLQIYYGGVNVARKISIATTFSEDLTTRFSGNKIKTIYSALGQGVKSATFWIRKQINGENLWETTVTEFTPNTMFTVDCDYVIEGTSLYLGYTATGDFTSGSIFYTENSSSLSLIVADANDNWMDYSSNGTAFFVCETEGDAGLVQNDLAITNISISDRAMAGEAFNIVGQLTNFGAYPVTSFKTKAIVNGQEIVNEHEVDTVLHKGTIDFAIPTTAPAHAGCYYNDIQVIEVNGATDGYPADNAITTQLLALAESYPRKVVMEEFTGTWCGWCPRGMAGIECLQRDYPDDFIAIAVHGGDTFEPETYTPILNSASGFPSALINRVVEADPYYGLTEVNYGIKD